MERYTGSSGSATSGSRPLPTRTGAVPAATVERRMTPDRIAAAHDAGEVFRLGVAALVEVAGPARCLIFDRDEYGQLGLAHEWDAPQAARPVTDPLAIADEIQSWWMTVLQAGDPLPGPRPSPLSEYPNTYVVPLLAGELLHGMVVLQECRRRLDPLVEWEVIAVVTAMSLTLHAFVLRRQLADAVPPEQVGEAITQERRRIAREIHDGVAQSLGYLLLKTELIDRLIERDPAAAREQALQLRATLQQAIGELRRSIGDLRRPSPAQVAGITTQLRSLVSTLGEMPNLELALQQVSGVRLAPEVERTVIGIVRESLANIRKHASANHVRVEVQRDGDNLRLTVADDGKGFDPQQAEGELEQHFGVKQMSELAQELGGDLTISSQPGAGARVEALIPVRPARPARP